MAAENMLDGLVGRAGRYYLGCDASGVDRLPFAGGVVAVCSQRRPTQPGKNEDAVLILPLGDQTGIIAIADGCGGMAHGERAAELALAGLARGLQRALQAGEMLPASPAAAGPPAGPDPNGSQEHGSAAGGASRQRSVRPVNVRAAVLDGIELAERAVKALGMGSATTLSVVEIDQRLAGRTRIRPYHVGDSSILLMGSHGRLKHQSNAHSPVGYAIQAGVLDEQEAIHHEERHLVSNVIGAHDAHIEVGPSRMMALRDTLLVASDGLMDNLHTEEIVEVARKGPLDQALQRLVDLATQRMCHPAADAPSHPDDLSIVLFRRE